MTANQREFTDEEQLVWWRCQIVSLTRRFWLDVPYPVHCRTPERCAGLSCCPNDPVCID